jgi:hypothetical protein
VPSLPSLRKAVFFIYYVFAIKKKKVLVSHKISWEMHEFSMGLLILTNRILILSLWL